MAYRSSRVSPNRRFSPPPRHIFDPRTITPKKQGAEPQARTEPVRTDPIPTKPAKFDLN